MPGQKQMSGGLAHTAVKNLNGARLCAPRSLIVETKAMGRGRITPTNSFSMSCADAGTKADERRLGAYRGEKPERRQVMRAALVDCGNEGDGPGQDHAHQ